MVRAVRQESLEHRRPIFCTKSGWTPWPESPRQESPRPSSELERSVMFDGLGLGRVELPTSRLSGRDNRKALTIVDHNRPPLTNNLLGFRW